MPQVELIYAADCPNVPAARAQLLRAFAAAGLTARWQEWERNAQGSPGYAHGFGSPTILINGADAAGHHTGFADAACCRLYAHGAGELSGIPALQAIVAKLRDAHKAETPASGVADTWNSTAATLPTLGVALLPKLTCPACWPAYTSLLSSLGLGFINFTPYLLPLTALFLVVSLAALSYRARHRRGYGPLWVGVAAGALILIGKFGFGSNPALYSGIALLMGASVWNVWPRVQRPCLACVPAGQGVQSRGNHSI